MVHIEDLSKISGNAVMFSIFLLSGSICPGMLSIWYFAPAVIKEMGGVIFLLLSFALTLPIVAINLLAFIFFLESINVDIIPPVQTNIKPELFSRSSNLVVSFAACTSMLIIGIPLLISYLWSFSLKSFSWTLIAIQIVWLILVLIISAAGRRIEEKKKIDASAKNKVA